VDVGNILLKDIAIRKNIGAQENTSLRELLTLMDDNKKGVVVLLSGQKSVGILTERDVVQLLFSGVDLGEPGGPHAKKNLIVASERRTIGYALSLMVENTVRRLVVIDSSGNFIGVVTQKDLLHHLEEDFYRSELKVSHIFDQLKDLVIASRTDPIFAVLKKMVEHKISAVPILEHGKAVGIITEKDILKLANSMVSLNEPVSGHMASPVICADPDSKLIDIVKTMNSRDISRVIIKNNEFLERKLRNTKEVLNLLPEMLLELIDTGVEQLVVWANAKVLERFGREIIDKPVTELIPERKWNSIYSTLTMKSRVEDVRFNIDESVFECSGFYLALDGTTERGRMQLILRDITEEVILATTDPLTGAYNRRFMSEFLENEVERSIRTKKTFAIALADLDDFKNINDTYGHPSGDIVLKEVVKVINRSTRKYDLVGRHGGEEFIVILPEIDKDTAVSVAERIRSTIEIHEIELVEGAKVRITASIGVAFFDEDGISPDDLLLIVDRRLYSAKRSGKNRVIYQ
jgi:diguanylate cyclase (GGDEF)-like protein